METQLKRELSEESKKLFQDFIRQKSGLKIEESPSLLSFSLMERIKATNKQNASEYVNFLMFHPEGRKELAEFLELLTIKETYFFRNPPHFKTLQEKILPEIIKNNRIPLFNLKIWSAGCSTGEEPYSLAIVAKENIPEVLRWKVEILATDLSKLALSTALQGTYGERAVKFVDKNILKKYFHHRQDKYYLSEEIKKMVTFQIHNLATDEFPQGWDIIFCRNVTIYFPKEITRQIMLNFHRSLKDNGYLIIGHSESLYGYDLPFRVIDMEDAFVYCKQDKVKEVLIPPKIFAKPTSLRAEVEKSRSDFKLQTSNSLDIEELYFSAEKHFKNKKYQEATNILQQILEKKPNLASAWSMLGKICANRGDYQSALDFLKKATTFDSLMYDTYFLLGVIYSKVKTNIDEAINYLKKSVYANPDFPLSHFYLASIYKDVGKIRDSIREYKNTLSLLNSHPIDNVQGDTEEISPEFLKKMCEDNIKNLNKLIK